MAAGDKDNFSGELSFTAPSGGVVTGLLYSIGETPVVARETKAENLAFLGGVSGVYEITKETAAADDAGAVGDKAYFDPATNKVTGDSATTNAVEIGIFVEAAAQAATTGKILLK